MTTVSQELLKDVKNELDITWQDDATDLKITGIILRGARYLDKKSGNELDYEKNERPKEILIEYCRAAHNHVLHEFVINYAPFIADLKFEGGKVYGQ